MITNNKSNDTKQDDIKKLEIANIDRTKSKRTPRRKSFNINNILHNNLIFEDTEETEDLIVHQKIYISNDINDKQECYDLMIKENNLSLLTQNDYLSDDYLVIIYKIVLNDLNLMGEIINTKINTIGYILASITIYYIFIDDICVKSNLHKKFKYKLINEVNKYIQLCSLNCHLNETISSPRIRNILFGV